MLTRLTPVAASSVPLSRAMQHLRVSGAAYEADVGPLLLSATAFVEEATGRAFAPGTWRQTFPCWEATLELTVCPVREVTSVGYLDADEAEQTVDGEDWYWVPTQQGAQVYFRAGFVPPTLADRPDAVRITYDAGCDPADSSGSGDDPALALPPTAEHAILLVLGQWFEQRSGIIAGAGNTVAELPFATRAILQQLRIFR